ncbi:MAG: hypothetical protein JNK02_12795 [Planctomycetes bacterium]|nr:hypothetical protein [Planctomycetota bacterium]
MGARSVRPTVAKDRRGLLLQLLVPLAGATLAVLGWLGWRAWSEPQSLCGWAGF